jgi:hypothetical protein
LRRTWEAGLKVVKFVGFDSTEDHRTYSDGGNLKVAPSPGLPPFGERYTVKYPLREWGFDRAKCAEVIAAAGLPVPPKSACFFCPAMRQIEIAALRKSEPDLYALSLEMERLYRDGHHFRGDDDWTVKGRHKRTGERQEVHVLAKDAAGARGEFRRLFKDSSPYQWQVSVSRAVSGLGRHFAWKDVS